MELEDMYHFEVGGCLDEGDGDISLTCLRCAWGEWIEVAEDETGKPVTLADLFERAQRHLDGGEH